QLEPHTTATNGENDKSSDLRDLGMRYRRARLKLGISLRDAAKRSGLPPSFISTFERTGLGSTVSSLQKLATAYGTSITELASAAPEKNYGDQHVVRHGKARQAPAFGQGIQIYQLAEALESLDCQQWVLQPGAESDGA